MKTDTLLELFDFRKRRRSRRVPADFYFAPPHRRNFHLSVPKPPPTINRRAPIYPNYTRGRGRGRGRGARGKIIEEQFSQLTKNIPEQFTVKAHPALFEEEGEGEGEREGQKN